MKEVISSIKNEKVKYLRKLYKKKYRKKEKKYILEGVRIIEEALRAGANLDMIFVTAGLAESNEGQELLKHIPEEKLIFLKESLLNNLADTSNSQGIIAIVAEREDNDNFWQKGEFILVLDRIQDPGNMGTIIRTAVAAGIDGIIALKGCVDIYNLKVLRSTMGAIFNIPVTTDIDLKTFLAIINKRKETKLVCADLHDAVPYHQVDYQDPLMLVVGNEARGIRPELLKKADLKVKIPIIGQIESLNVAMATGILLYKIVEGKKFQKF